MTSIPQKLADLISELSAISDRYERAEVLIEIADRFPDSKVPPEIAAQPYSEDHRARGCESEAFVWAVDQPDGTLKYYFDVLNPQGLSAKAMSVIIDETCSGVPIDQIVAIHDDIVLDIFGREVSMGKGIGLTGIVALARQQARMRLT